MKKGDKVIIVPDKIHGIAIKRNYNRILTIKDVVTSNEGIVLFKIEGIDSYATERDIKLANPNMIYTIGHTESYMEAVSKHQTVYKLGKTADYEGGYGFETVEQAQAYVAKLGEIGNYSVYGLDCDMSNTIPNDGYLNLIKDTAILLI